jgi:hypothetical protein
LGIRLLGITRSLPIKKKIIIFLKKVEKNLDRYLKKYYLCTIITNKKGGQYETD